jgi:hypothetical protein
MLKRALLLKDAINEYYNNYPNITYKDDKLDKSDWEVLKKVKSFLDKMKIAIKILESSNRYLDLVLPVMDYVLQQFKLARAKYKDDLILGPMFQLGWSKFDNYYHLTNNTYAYIAALVLNP